MSNPAVYVLSETKIKNTRVCIEDNLGEAIHIHIGQFRVSMTIDEFYKIADQIITAADEILQLSDLSLEMFDKGAFDWNWLCRYEEIEKIEKVNVKVEDLLTKGESKLAPGMNHIVRVADSRQYKALNNDIQELERYDEKNKYGISNLERLKIVLNLIKEKGYPYDEKYIMVNQYNQIYDGDHRAACLLFLNIEEIPVIRITLKNEKTIEEQKEIEQSEIERFYLKGKKETVYMWSEDLNELNITFKELTEKIENMNIGWYSIERPWSGTDGEAVADKIIVIKENRVIDFCKFMNISYYGKSEYRHYQFLYSMQRCVYIELTDARVLVFDRLSCKSKFENSIMPLDKEIQNMSWKNIESNKAGLKTELIYVIVDSLLNGAGFSKQNEKFVSEHIDLLQCSDFRKLIKKIFFNYSDMLIEYLKIGDFKKAYTEYISNEDY